MRKPAVLKPAVLIPIIIGVLVIFGLGYWAGFTVAREAGQLICSANPCRITLTRNGKDGLVIKDAHGPQEENPLLIVDPNGLAEFWQNAKGAYEGPKGEICTTDSKLAPLACLGGNARTGWVRIDGQTLTAADIAWLHHAEHAGSVP